MSALLAFSAYLAAAGAPVAPDFSVSVEPPEVAQGGIVQVLVRSLGPRPPKDAKATLGDATAQATRWDQGSLLALLPVRLEAKLGPRTVEVAVTDARGGQHKVTLILTVVAGDFETDELGVKKFFTDPSPRQRAQAKADAQAFETIWKRADPVRLWRGPFQAPTSTAATARYGTFRTINGRTKSRHQGLDLKGARGDPIRAANDGRVALARGCFYSGNTVVLDHGNGVHTLYFHLTQFKVKAGQMVKRGQVLGTVGDTGRVTGPHLHWGVKLSNVYVDPQALLRLPLAADPRAPQVAAPRPPSPLRSAAVVEDAGPGADAATPPQPASSAGATSAQQ
jgi:murein DD-endopeptidase MepM/ murein hydrolase activator NlpD